MIREQFWRGNARSHPDRRAIFGVVADERFRQQCLEQFQHRYFGVARNAPWLRRRLEQICLVASPVPHHRLLVLGSIPGLVTRLKADQSGCAGPTDDSRAAADQI